MDVKQSLLDAGATLLREQGIAALTQPRVAKAAGVKQSHLTYYFPKRSDLLLAIAEHSIARVMAELQSRGSTEPPERAIASTLAEAAVDGVPPRVMLGLVVAADAEPSIRAPLRELVSGVRKRVRSLLVDASIDDSEEAAMLLHAVVVGLAVLHEARRTSASAREVSNGISAMLRLLHAAARQPAAGEAR